MKIVIASNWFNHHEKFFSDALNSFPDVDFHFIQTEQIPQDRLDLGYQDITRVTSYCICSYDSQEIHRKALDICNDADVLILGSAPYEFIAERVKHNKLTFYYAERLFRKGLWHLLYPPTFITVLKRFIIPGRKSNFYLLAASGYTAIDTSKIFAFNNRRYKWGHLIEVDNSHQRKYDSESNKLKLLWVGRFLKLKHPEYAIEIANTLKRKDVDFTLDIIGTGDKEETLKKLVARYELQNYVTFYGSMKPTEVREFMEQADIYMFTSDFNEGWGAVLGESMSAGCAAVTSHGIGATPFLAQHNYNALIYETGNYGSFERNVLKLVESKQLREKLSKNAIMTMQTLWNPKVGAERFYTLCKSLIETGEQIYYDNGPISKAEIIKNNWFKEDTI